MDGVLNALTIDVEEHFHAHAFEAVIARSAWDTYPSRVVANTRRILHLLGEHGVQATFFTLGWVADRHPDLVREIAAAGHEIATHGYWHELVYRQTPDEFAADLRRSLEAIGQALGGTPPTGYRAPSFSITARSLWALDVLRDCDMAYDSSIFPLSAHDRYGIGDADRFANRLPAGLWEFPASTVRLAGRNWPVAGGGYFRLLPLSITRRAIRHLNAEGHPAVVYLHPWEFDPEQPRVVGASSLSRFRHYVNLERTEARLRALLQRDRFGPIRQAFHDCLAAAPLGARSVPEPAQGERALEAGR